MFLYINRRTEDAAGALKHNRSKRKATSLDLGLGEGVKVNMGRAPCCEKMGLKKGPWTPEEDLILINYINAHGHTNWRALPKQAGLLRCGKSCRLRWTNYLRPDIKRGNFTREEEDTIIELHQMLGNRWSAIAAKLPGRTDNEIKNVWHTHLKKRLQQQPQQHQHQYEQSHDTKRKRKPKQTKSKQEQKPVNVNFPTNEHDHDHVNVNIDMIKSESADTDHQRRPLSPLQCSSSDVSTLSASHDSSNITTNNDHDMSINNNNNAECLGDDSNNLALDEDFWSEVLSADNSDEKSDFPAIHDQQLQFPFSPLLVTQQGVHDLASSSSMCNNDMDFWYDIYTRAEGLIDQLPEL